LKHLAITLVKFKALQRLLNAPLCHAVGYLETLWIFAQLQAREGDLTKFSALEIAGWVEYPGDPDEFIEALVKTRWLERVDDRLMIHDWNEHKPNWLKGVSSRPSNGLSNLPSPEPGNGPSPEPTPPPPKPKPKPSLSQTIPNQTMPSLAYADLAGDAGEQAAVLDFLALAGEDKIRDVVRQAKAIEKAFGKVFNSAAEVWEIAWVGYACREGFVPDIIERFKSLQGTERAVKQPKRWLLGALKKELDDTGVSLEEAFQCVVPWEEFKTQGATV
jgi:hypothetical protein